MKEKRAMIIAPHPDDEINLAGQILPYLQEDGYEIYVVYTTNGDSDRKIGNKRLKEALNACEVLGIPTNHVIFLGYANEWEKGKHLYNEDYDIQLTSKIGKTETNSLTNHPEFCYMNNGHHNLFTKTNFINDLSSVISCFKPEVIICVDFDTHPDHRAATLAFDEAICKILKEDYKYKPLVLKRFAYNGTWKGIKDYYSYSKTKLLYGFNYLGGLHELEAPSYSKDDEIRIISSEKTITSLLSKNPIYKAAKMHKCTVAWYQMLRVLNSDVVYFLRNTNNLVLHASITSTSGEVNYLNDFKLYDTKDVLNISEPFSNIEYCWRPTDIEKTFSVKWNEKVSVKKIIVYEDPNIFNHIKLLEISLGSEVVNVEPHYDGSGTIIDLNKEVITDCIRVRMVDYIGNPGLSEFEVLDSNQKKVIENFFPLKEYSSIINNNKIFILLEKIILDLKFLLKFKIKYEIEKRMSYKVKCK